MVYKKRNVTNQKELREAIIANNVKLRYVSALFFGSFPVLIFIIVAIWVGEILSNWSAFVGIVINNITLAAKAGLIAFLLGSFVVFLLGSWLIARGVCLILINHFKKVKAMRVYLYLGFKFELLRYTDAANVSPFEEEKLGSAEILTAGDNLFLDGNLANKIYLGFDNDLVVTNEIDLSNTKRNFDILSDLASLEKVAEDNLSASFKYEKDIIKYSKVIYIPENMADRRKFYGCKINMATDAMQSAILLDKLCDLILNSDDEAAMETTFEFLVKLTEKFLASSLKVVKAYEIWLMNIAFVSFFKDLNENRLYTLDRKNFLVISNWIRERAEKLNYEIDKLEYALKAIFAEKQTLKLAKRVEHFLEHKDFLLKKYQEIENKSEFDVNFLEFSSFKNKQEFLKEIGYFDYSLSRVRNALGFLIDKDGKTMKLQEAILIAITSSKQFN